MPSTPRFQPAVSLLLTLFTSTAGCDDDVGGPPSINRIAPWELTMAPNEHVRYEIRGCVVEGADRVGPSETGDIEVVASARSGSSGTVRLAMPFTEPSEPDEQLAASAPVVPGQSTRLEVGHFFYDWLAIESHDLQEQCCEWITVEFGWLDVEGSEPLEVAWQGSFAVILEFEEGIALGIDFRPTT